MELTAKAETLRQMHDRRPLVLPNAWDVGSACALVAGGAPAIATTSAGVARSLGYEDHEDMPADVAFDAVARITRAVDVPVTADIESGYGLDPDEIASRLLAAGAVGCNLEDTDHRTGGLVAPEAHAARINAVVEAAERAGVPLVVNARVDCFARRAGASDDERVDLSVERARAYLDAGAACTYPILVTGDVTVAALVQRIPGPVNILHLPGGPTIARLGELGVARVTFGSSLHRTAMEELTATAARLVAGGDP